MTLTSSANPPSPAKPPSPATTEPVHGETAGDVDPAIAAAPAETLGDHRRFLVANGGNDIGVDIKRHRSGPAAGGAETADAEAQRIAAAVVSGKRDAAGNVDAAITAPAADALDQNAVGAAFAHAAFLAVDGSDFVRLQTSSDDVAVDGRPHGAGVARRAAETADADRRRDRVAGRAARKRAGNIGRTIAAAAADALHRDGVRARAPCNRRAVPRERHAAAVAARAAETADPDRRAGVGVLGKRDAAGDVETARAAAAAEALRQHAESVRAQGLDRAG